MRVWSSAKKTWAEDKNWEVVSVWMLFKTTGLHGITKGMSIDNEEKRSKDTLLEYSNIKKMRNNQKRRPRNDQWGRYLGVLDTRGKNVSRRKKLPAMSNNANKVRWGLIK